MTLDARSYIISNNQPLKIRNQIIQVAHHHVIKSSHHQTIPSPIDYTLNEGSASPPIRFILNDCRAS
ncbi:MAG: hypothetical protein AAFX87_30335, partial [Bacteroidota bacterium]